MFLTGFIIAVPNINSIFMDFSQFSTEAITLIRMGLATAVIWVVFK